MEIVIKSVIAWDYNRFNPVWSSSYEIAMKKGQREY